MTRALDLLVAAERHARHPAKVPLHRTLAHPVDIALDRRIGGIAARDDARACQARNQKPASS